MVHQPEEVATELQKKNYLSHKEILDKGQIYKNTATSYSFEVDDPQEIQERDFLRGHPSNYSSLTGGSHTSVIDIKQK
jgi:hypothetical protein